MRLFEAALGCLARQEPPRGYVGLKRKKATGIGNTRVDLPFVLHCIQNLYSLSREHGPVRLHTWLGPTPETARRQTQNLDQTLRVHKPHLISNVVLDGHRIQQSTANCPLSSSGPEGCEGLLWPLLLPGKQPRPLLSRVLSQWRSSWKSRRNCRKLPERREPVLAFLYESQSHLYFRENHVGKASGYFDHKHSSQ